MIRKLTQRPVNLSHCVQPKEGRMPEGKTVRMSMLRACVTHAVTNKQNEAKTTQNSCQQVEQAKLYSDLLSAYPIKKKKDPVCRD